MNVENLDYGPAKVYVNGQEIGFTKNGVVFTFEREFQDLTADQYGTSVLDKALKGNNMMVAFALAEVTHANLAKALPEGRFDQPDTSDEGKLGFGRKPGYKLSQDAVELRVHPIRYDDNNVEHDVYIWKAVSAENVELPFSIDDQRVVEVTFQALVDTDRTDGYLLGRVGDDIVS